MIASSYYLNFSIRLRQSKFCRRRTRLTFSEIIFIEILPNYGAPRPTSVSIESSSRGIRQTQLITQQRDNGLYTINFELAFFDETEYLLYINRTFLLFLDIFRIQNFALLVQGLRLYCNSLFSVLLIILGLFNLPFSY